jgi:hypothetical protein
MPLLALLQANATADRTILYVLGAIALVTLIVLGLRFFRNLFEVITAPAASLKYHGQNDHFFFSLMVVFFAGTIATIIFLVNQPKVVATFDNYAGMMATDIAAGNSNATYRDVAKDMAQKTMNDNFDIFFVQNTIMLPLFFVALWLVIGFLSFLFARIMTTGITAVDMLGTTAYSAFFSIIGLALAGTLVIELAGQGVGITPAPSPAAIAGVVLILYAVVLFLMGVNQAADLTAGQTIGVIIILLIVLGGAGFLIKKQGGEKFAEFKGRIQSFNPANRTPGAE